MAKYKVTKIFIVEASSKQEAVELVMKDPDTLEMVFVKEVPEQGTWDAVKSQLTGK